LWGIAALLVEKLCAAGRTPCKTNRMTWDKHSKWSAFAAFFAGEKTITIEGGENESEKVKEA